MSGTGKLQTCCWRWKKNRQGFNARPANPPQVRLLNTVGFVPDSHPESWLSLFKGRETEEKHIGWAVSVILVWNLAPLPKSPLPGFTLPCGWSFFERADPGGLGLGGGARRVFYQPPPICCLKAIQGVECQILVGSLGSSGLLSSGGRHIPECALYILEISVHLI